MNKALLLLFCGALFGGSVAQASNKECKDLSGVAKKLKASPNVKLLPRTSIDCKPNKNCSGLTCGGQFNGKQFKNITIALQGCTNPVTLRVHYGKTTLVIKDGSKTHLAKKLYAVTTITKNDNIVTVTIVIKFCATKNTCVTVANLVDHKKITVNCGNLTRPTLLSGTWPTPVPDKKGTISRNPECRGWETSRTMMERNFNIVTMLLGKYQHHISCNPTKDCSELKCSGYANEDDFTSSLFIDYCSTPVTMRLAVDVPTKQIHVNHTFKDGQNFTIYNIPMVVHLKRIDNAIYVTISMSLGIIGKKDIVKNMRINVDPKRCPGHHYQTLFPPTRMSHGQHCRSMMNLGKSIEKSGPNINCSTIHQCRELQCEGIFAGGRFTSITSMNYCCTPITMNMTVKTDKKTYSHLFKNGDTYKMPQPMTVGLKKAGNTIFINISITKFDIVKNQPFIIDSERCPSTGSSKSVSKGAIAGIVIGVVFFILLLVAVVAFLVKRKGLSTRVARYNDLAMHDDTDPLCYDFEPAVA